MRPRHDTDSVRGRAGALATGAVFTGMLALVRGPVVPRLAVLVGVTAVAGAIAWWAMRSDPADAQRGPLHVRASRSRSACRRARRRGFVLVTVPIVLGVGALVGFGWWDALLVVPGVLAALLVLDVHAAGHRLVDVRPRPWIPVLLVPLLALSWPVDRTLASPGPDPFEIRLVEWVRDHGGGGVVNSVEHWWYTSHPPPVGGTPRALVTPRAPTGPVGAAVDPVIATPIAPVPSPTKTPLGDEGVWSTTAGSARRPIVATTLVRPDAVHTSLVVGLMRIDPSQCRLHLVSGTEQPDGIAPSGGQVPADDRPRLLAAFNAGFRMKESIGGWFGEGRTARPLVAGAASLVLRDDGRVDVGQWGRDDSMDAHVVAVRQNLALIVDHGGEVPGITSASNERWGATLGHRVLVARSGIGVTADGMLVYVGGPALSIKTLADTLIAGGAVRAMELDINTDWVDAYTFRAGPDGPVGTKLVDAMRFDPTHYLRPQSRDFVEVTAN